MPVAATDNMRMPRWLRAVLAVTGVAILTVMPLVLVYGGIVAPVWGMASPLVGLAATFWLIRAHLGSILLVFTIVLLVSNLAASPSIKVAVDRVDRAQQLSTAWAAAGPFDDSLPIVLHLVFDELMSPGAMTDDLPGGTDTRNGVLAMARRHGFRLYDSVYSRDFFSAESLPNLMHPEFLGGSGLTEVFTEQQEVHEVNPYFDKMAARGYRTAVFQTTHMNFCTNRAVDLCETFDSFDPGGDDYGGLDLRARTATLWQTLMNAHEPSYAASLGRRLLNWLPGVGPYGFGVEGVAGRFDVQRFPGWFAQFLAFAPTVPRGTHVFAHFMVPHAPYLLTGDCIVSGRFDTGYYLATRAEPGQRDELRKQYYSAYLAQVRCLTQTIETLLDSIKLSPDYRDALIVIHGDHGSRISVGNVLEDYEARDFIDNYATFFAVKGPGVAPGVDCTFASLSETFRSYMRPEFEATPRRAGPLPVHVISRAANNAKVAAPMPRFGCSTEMGASE